MNVNPKFKGVVFIAACALAFAGCKDGGKRSWAKFVDGNSPFNNTAPAPVPNPQPPPMPAAPGTSVSEVIMGTPFESQSLDDITRLVTQGGTADYTQAGQVGVRFANHTGNPNVKEVMIFLNMGPYDNDNPVQSALPSVTPPLAAGRPFITPNTSFSPHANMHPLQPDTWTSPGTTDPEYDTFSPFTRQGNTHLFTAVVRVPVSGGSHLVGTRVDRATRDSASNDPSFYIAGLNDRNTGFVVGKGIHIYVTEVNGVWKAFINHVVAGVPNPQIPNTPPSPPGGSGGGGGSSGGNQAPTINTSSVSPVVTGSIAAVSSDITPVVSLTASDADGTTPTLNLFQSGGSVSLGITTGMTSGGNGQWSLTVPTVDQRHSVQLQGTASDGIATVTTDINLVDLVPNHFAGIANVSTKTTTRLTDAPNTSAASAAMRTRSDGFGYFAFDPTPVVISGVYHIRCYTYNGSRLGNTHNVNPPSPVGYPNGSSTQLDGGYNGKAGSSIGGQRYEYLIPLGDTVGAHYQVQFAVNGVAGQNTSGLPASAFFQTGEYDNYHAVGRGIAITLNSSGEWEFDKTYTGVDQRLMVGGQYETSGYPILN